jgi:putative transposase
VGSTGQGLFREGGDGINMPGHRRSIRLKGYDYSQNGYYFVTICIQDRESLLGNIHSGKMILNEAGRMVETTWMELPHKYSHVQIIFMELW